MGSGTTGNNVAFTVVGAGTAAAKVGKRGFPSGFQMPEQQPNLRHYFRRSLTRSFSLSLSFYIYTYIFLPSLTFVVSTGIKAAGAPEDIVDLLSIHEQFRDTTGISLDVAGNLKVTRPKYPLTPRTSPSPPFEQQETIPPIYNVNFISEYEKRILRSPDIRGRVSSRRCIIGSL